jgi:hypothetical protein
LFDQKQTFVSTISITMNSDSQSDHPIDLWEISVNVLLQSESNDSDNSNQIVQDRNFKAPSESASNTNPSPISSLFAARIEDFAPMTEQILHPAEALQVFASFQHDGFESGRAAAATDPLSELHGDSFQTSSPMTGETNPTTPHDSDDVSYTCDYDYFFPPKKRFLRRKLREKRVALRELYGPTRKKRRQNNDENKPRVPAKVTPTASPAPSIDQSYNNKLLFHPAIEDSSVHNVDTDIVEAEFTEDEVVSWVGGHVELPETVSQGYEPDDSSGLSSLSDSSGFFTEATTEDDNDSHFGSVDDCSAEGSNQKVHIEWDSDLDSLGSLQSSTRNVHPILFFEHDFGSAEESIAEFSDDHLSSLSTYNSYDSGIHPVLSFEDFSGSDEETNNQPSLFLEPYYVEFGSRLGVFNEEEIEI